MLGTTATDDELSASTLEPAIPTPTPPLRWSPFTRLAFRLVFCYFMLYALCCGNATIWSIVPGIGLHLEAWFNWPFQHAAQWLAQHMFHVQGVGAHIHHGGSGDTVIQWISIGVMLGVAIAATLLWTALDRHRTHYKKLFGWMRFTLRLTIGVAMIGYGLVKVFPLQMAPPSLAVLNEPLGNTSPMTLLWTLIGLYPLYEMICGATEVLAGTLILFRRTALIGALFTAFLVSNVVLYNFFFDVPVKIYASHLLMMALIVIAPDVRSLFRYFILHKPAVPTGNWMLPANRRKLRIETITLTIVLLLIFRLTSIGFYRALRYQLANERHPSPLSGQWHITSATPHPLLSANSQPITDIFIEPFGRTMLRAADQHLWRAGIHTNNRQHTLTLNSVGISMVYTIVQSSPTQMLLTPIGNKKKDAAILDLTRIPLPTHYPLEDRGFHLVTEFGLER